jgi:hypothetical protein
MLLHQAQRLFLLWENVPCPQGQDGIAFVVGLLDPVPCLIQLNLITKRISTGVLDIVPISRSPLEEDLLRNPSCQGMQVCARVASRKVIATADLEIGLLDQRRPDQPGVAAVNDIQSAVGLGSRQTVIDGDMAPGSVEVHTKYVLSVLGDLRSVGLAVKGVHQ